MKNKKKIFLFMLLGIIVLGGAIWAGGTQSPSESVPEKYVPIGPHIKEPETISPEAKQEKLDRAEALFRAWVKKQGDYSDFEINERKFVLEKKVTPDPDYFYFGPDATEDAYIVSFDFSIKPIKQYSDWNAGNGSWDEKTGWVVHKFMFVQLDRKKGVYEIMNVFTGF